MMLLERAKGTGVRFVGWVSTVKYGFFQGLIAAVAVGGWLLWGYVTLSQRVDTDLAAIHQIQEEIITLKANDVATRNQMHDLDTDVRSTLDAVSGKLDQLKRR
jgi:cell division protein FtsB